MPKFSVGDKVIANESAESCKITKTGWTGIVERVDDDGTFFVKNFGSAEAWSGWVYESQFDLYTARNGFEVGDVIVALPEAERHYTYTCGDWVGRIINIREGNESDIEVDGIAEWDTGRSYWVCSKFFKKKATTTEEKPDIPSKDVLTNKDAFELLFGFTPRFSGCPTGNCKDCPHDTSNGGQCSDKSNWALQPYLGRFVSANPRALFHRTNTKRRITEVPKDELEQCCHLYNSEGDEVALKFLKDKELWTSEKQYQDLNTLLLMHELIFVHNSETVSETAYNVLLFGFFASIGIGIDAEGMAFARGKDSKKENE